MPRSKRVRFDRGFTLIEAMIAFAVVSFGILGVAALQNTALHRQSASRHSLIAAQVAKNQISEIRRLPWSALAETSNDGQDWEPLCETDNIEPGGNCVDASFGGTSGYPGASPSTLPMVTESQTQADGTTVPLVSFHLSWRIQDVAASGTAQCRKDVFLRVMWQQENFPVREHYLSTRLFNSLGDRNASGSDLGILDAQLTGGC